MWTAGTTSADALLNQRLLASPAVASCKRQLAVMRSVTVPGRQLAPYAVTIGLTD